VQRILQVCDAEDLGALDEAIQQLERARELAGVRRRPGRPTGRGTYPKGELLELVATAAAALWYQLGRAPTQAEVAHRIGYSPSGLEKALRRQRSYWSTVKLEARRRSFGRIKADLAA